MGTDQSKLAARREGLLRRSAELRSSIIEDAAAISRQLRVVDTATAFLRSGGARAIVLGGLSLFLISGPARALKVASRTALMWSLARRWLPRVLAYKRGRHRA